MQAAAAGGGAGTRSRVIGEGLPPRPNNERDRRFKIIVLGPVGGGKTSISRRYVHNTFALHPTTLGLDHLEKQLAFNGGDRLVKLDIWDTAGTEKYKAANAAMYRDALGIILVYDLTRKQSFCDAKDWLQRIHDSCIYDPAVVFVGNKADLEDDRHVHEDAGRQAAQKEDIPFFETSAKTGANIDEVFRCMVEQILEKYQQDEDHFNRVTCVNGDSAETEFQGQPPQTDVVNIGADENQDNAAPERKYQCCLVT